MLQELKMKSLKGHAASIIIALALAAGLLWGTGFGAFKAIGGPKPLDSLDVSELKGQYVEAEVYLIYDWYAYTERTNTSTNRSTVTEKEYIIPVGDAEYMGLAVDAGYISTADDLLDASYELLTGASDPVKMVPQIVEELNQSGMDKIIKAVQAQIDAYYK